MMSAYEVHTFEVQSKHGRKQRYLKLILSLTLGVIFVFSFLRWEVSKMPKCADEVAKARSVSVEYNICQVPSDQNYGYVCQGNAYDSFADNMKALVDQEARLRPSLWGKREFPFPPNSTILAVGNSLTRQVFQGLPCQYPNQVEAWIDRESNSTNLMRRGTFYEGLFENGSRIFLVTNHAMFYSPKWPVFLSELIGIDDLWGGLDALVVGHINHFMNAYNTSFMELMNEQTKKWDGANFETVSPPTIMDFANIFKGPIVGVSMMADWSTWDEDYFEMSSEVMKMKRENIRLVHGRKYIEQLGECGSNAWQEIGTCQDSPDMHRCIGARGGHPDLIAWDMVEDVNELLS